jgi:hypothetical protein
MFDRLTRERAAGHELGVKWGIFVWLMVGLVPVWAGDYHVAIGGADENPGTRDHPWKTIQKAAEVLQPGDRVLIHAGTYREWVRPPRGGTSEEKRIIYQAAPGEEVILKGSEVVDGWVREGATWRRDLPDEFFGERNPFKTNLAGDWLHFGYENHLGEVYLDGVSLREVFSDEELARTAGSWRVEASPGVTGLRVNFGDANPNASLVEVNARASVFFPKVKGLGFITLDGLTIAQTAPQWVAWLVFQEGAVGTYFGHHWTIENCRFMDAKCVALVAGNDPSYENDGFDMQSVGRHLVRNNHFMRCGEAAIHGFKGWAGSIIEGNLIEDINPKRQFGGEESGGIKIHLPIDVTVRNNIIRRVFSGKPEGYTKKKPLQYTGIWIDWAGQGTRVSGNVVYETEAWSLFLQNNQGSPLLVDHNIFDRNVIVESRGVVFVHNLFLNSGWTVRGGADVAFWKPHSAIKVGVAPTAAADVKWWNNLFIGKGAETFPNNPGYAADWNAFLAGAKPTTWGDAHSVVGDGAAPVFKSLPDGVEIVMPAGWVPPALGGPLVTSEFVGPFELTGQGLEDRDGRPLALDSDLLGHPRESGKVVPGPVQPQAGKHPVIRLRAGPVAR